MFSDLPAVMRDHTGYLLVRLGKRAQRAFEEMLAPLGLRPPHFDVLAVLAEQGPHSQREIATVLAVDAARLVALADELAQLGAVVRTTDARDRRRNQLEITDRGCELFASARAAAHAVQASLMAPLDPAEVAALRELLQRLNV